jgi:hypothetical protein
MWRPIRLVWRRAPVQVDRPRPERTENNCVKIKSWTQYDVARRTIDAKPIVKVRIGWVAAKPAVGQVWEGMVLSAYWQATDVCFTTPEIGETWGHSREGGLWVRQGLLFPTHDDIEPGMSLQVTGGAKTEMSLHEASTGEEQGQWEVTIFCDAGASSRNHGAGAIGCVTSQLHPLGTRQQKVVVREAGWDITFRRKGEDNTERGNEKEIGNIEWFWILVFSFLCSSR